MRITISRVAATFLVAAAATAASASSALATDTSIDPWRPKQVTVCKHWIEGQGCVQTTKCLYWRDGSWQCDDGTFHYEPRWMDHDDGPVLPRD